MTRRKTTLYLDDDLLTATKVVAATSARSESDVVTEALRAYLQREAAQTAAAEVRALMARVTERGQADEKDAMQLAIEETGAVRKRRRSTR